MEERCNNTAINDMEVNYNGLEVDNQRKFEALYGEMI